MTFWMGVMLLSATVAMILLARPKNGVSAPFLRTWFVGQAYVLVALTGAVSGISMMILNRPF